MSNLILEGLGTSLSSCVCGWGLMMMIDGRFMYDLLASMRLNWRISGGRHSHTHRMR